MRKSAIAIILVMVFSLAPINASAGCFLDGFHDAFESIESGIRASCVLAFSKIQGRFSQQNFCAAREAGLATKVGTIDYSQISLLKWESDGYVWGITYNRGYLEQVLNEGDQLFVHNGRLVRWRESNQSVAIIPEVLEYFIANTVGFRVTDIRRSWVVQNLYPTHPEFSSVERLITREYSEWSNDSGFQFTGQLKIAKGGFLKLHLKIQPDGVEIWIRSRGDKEYEANVRDFVESQSTGPLNKLFATANTGGTIKLNQTSEAIQLLKQLADVQGLFF